MHRYKELEVRKKSMDLVQMIYKLTSTFPDHEKFGITSQLNRCAVSIPSNIAEGAGRNSKGEFKQFIGIAVGSLFELETQVLITNRIGYTSGEVKNSITGEVESVHKMLFGLKKSLN